MEEDCDESEADVLQEVDGPGEGEGVLLVVDSEGYVEEVHEDEEDHPHEDVEGVQVGVPSDTEEVEPVGDAEARYEVVNVTNVSSTLPVVTHLNKAQNNYCMKGVCNHILMDGKRKRGTARIL